MYSPDVCNANFPREPNIPIIRQAVDGVEREDGVPLLWKFAILQVQGHPDEPLKRGVMEIWFL